METQTEQAYQKLITTIIQKYMSVIGAYGALLLVQQVKELNITASGEVIEIKGNPQDVTRKVIEHYTNLSVPLTQKVLQPILAQFLSTQDSSSLLTIQDPNTTQQENIKS